jgi:acyl carrier protein
MTRQQIGPGWPEFKQVVADKFGTQADRVERNMSFIVDLGADSLDMIQVLMEIEDRYQIEIPQDEAAQLLTVGDAFDYVTERIAS